MNEGNAYIKLGFQPVDLICCCIQFLQLNL